MVAGPGGHVFHIPAVYGLVGHPDALLFGCVSSRRRRTVFCLLCRSGYPIRDIPHDQPGPCQLIHQSAGEYLLCRGGGRLPDDRFIAYPHNE